jgi:hypothetical protein
MYVFLEDSEKVITGLKQAVVMKHVYIQIFQVRH